MIIASLLSVALIICVATKAAGQAQELEELALDIEKLAQFKTILSDLEKGYAILSGGYTTIKNISEGNFNIHKAFLDGLLQVSPAVAKYKKIAMITGSQLQLIKEYKAAFSRFKKDGHFDAGEIDYIGKVYDNLVNESIKNLEELLSIITAGKLRMSDDERLKAIDEVYEKMSDKLFFLRDFNNKAAVLSLQRMKEQNDVNATRSLHGVK